MRAFLVECEHSRRAFALFGTRKAAQDWAREWAKRGHVLRVRELENWEDEL